MEKAKENTSGWKGQRARSCKAGKQRKSTKVLNLGSMVTKAMNWL